MELLQHFNQVLHVTSSIKMTFEPSRERRKFINTIGSPAPCPDHTLFYPQRLHFISWLLICCPLPSEQISEFPLQCEECVRRAPPPPLSRRINVGIISAALDTALCVSPLPAVRAQTPVGTSLLRSIDWLLISDQRTGLVNATVRSG